ncbi:sulfate adenylyltransferase subunit 1 [Aciditerrimonas ferrireducens]|jgi:sulfate adenylyltransferase subunit 1|uniref:sulfate adenylyltransferase n=1 Tax=Aciditerrimonas ferrireducens TaxID=667306 RepID=A0ABV6C3T9_9ACTN
MTSVTATETRPRSQLLRVAAVGSVDDGKSTLIGRLLHDTKQLFDDQLAALAEASRRRGLAGLDLSLVTDGLRAEREQGITIDVAYRYAATPTRKLVIADCPGHVQYTRNMATGASTADAAIVLVDATRGLREQTRRHGTIAARFGVRRWVVAVNKMDLADWAPERFFALAEEVAALADRLGGVETHCVPVSALHGANVVDRAAEAPWWEGPTVLEALEALPVGDAVVAGPGPVGGRLPVQWVLRPATGRRAYAGMVAGGPLRVGDEVVVLPSGARSTIRAIWVHETPVEVAAPRRSVALELADDLDVARGDTVARAEDPPLLASALRAEVCWFADQPVRTGDRFLLRHTTRLTRAVVRSVEGRLDLDDLRLRPAAALEANDLGVLTLEVAAPLAVDPYERVRTTGSFILVDEASQVPVAAGLLHEDLVP